MQCNCVITYLGWGVEPRDSRPLLVALNIGDLVPDDLSRLQGVGTFCPWLQGYMEDETTVQCPDIIYTEGALKVKLAPCHQTDCLLTKATHLQEAKATITRQQRPSLKNTKTCPSCTPTCFTVTCDSLRLRRSNNSVSMDRTRLKSVGSVSRGITTLSAIPKAIYRGCVGR